MPAIPVWIVTALWQYGVPLLITVFRQLGWTAVAEAWAVKRMVALANLKTYHDKQDFPGDRNGRPDTPAPDLEPGTTNTNLTVGDAPADDGYPREIRS